MTIGRTRIQFWSGGWDQVRWVFGRAAAAVLNEGAGACIRRISQRLIRVARGQTDLLPFSPRNLEVQYRRWRVQHAVAPAAIEHMRQDIGDLPYHPVISLVMPMSNAKAIWVTKAIESVRAQAYPYWNLSLYSDSPMSEPVQRIVNECAAHDSRITLTILPQDGTATVQGCSLLSLQSGDYVGLMGQHDTLAPEALFTVVKHISEYPDLDLLYSDHDTISPDGEYADPFFKPGWSPDLLLSMNYLSPLCVFRRTAIVEGGKDEKRVDPRDIYDLLLQFTERTGSIGHIPQVLYHARQGSAEGNHVGSCVQSSEPARAVAEAMRRRGEHGRVTSVTPGVFQIIRTPQRSPLVSIIIPTRDHGKLLERCLSSIDERTNYEWYEIIVLDNGSREPKTLRYLDAVGRKWRVHRCPDPFNFSSINNAGASLATGEYLLFLNNDVEVISHHWLTSMVAQAQRPGVGAVGAKLLYPDGSIQHAGVVIGINGVAGHAFRHSPTDAYTYHGLADVVRNCSAVTAACMLVPKNVFVRVQGFDERLCVEFNDIDLCLRIQRQGYRIVYTPEALLYHYENATRKGRRSPEDEALFKHLWGHVIKEGDPYYNPNLTRAREDWSLNA